jgi:hypothetical protein
MILSCLDQSEPIALLEAAVSADFAGAKSQHQPISRQEAPTRFAEFKPLRPSQARHLLCLHPL